MQAKTDLPLIITTTSDDGSVFKAPSTDPFADPGLFEVGLAVLREISKRAFAHALFRNMIFRTVTIFAFFSKISKLIGPQQQT